MDAILILTSVLGVLAAAGIVMSMGKKKGTFGSAKLFFLAAIGATVVLFVISAVPMLAILAGLGLPVVYIVGAWLKIFKW